MNLIQKLGLALFILALVIFIACLGLSKHELSEKMLLVDSDYHKSEILKIAEEKNLLGTTFNSNVSYISAFKSILVEAQNRLDQNVVNSGLPEGVGEWDYKIGSWKIKDYIYNNVKASSTGFLPSNITLMWLLSFGLGLLGGLLYILPQFLKIPGIKNDGIYHSSMTSGLKFKPRSFFLGATIIGVLLYGIKYQSGDFFWPAVTVLAIGIIYYFVYYKQNQKSLNPAKSASPVNTAWLGVITGIFLITFYILLYWFPHYITNWVLLVDPISQKLSGNPASQWFLYGFLYCLVVMVMGVRMISKYRHNTYQIIRTISVIFFQVCIAFLLPEILVRLNMPYYDFKNIWPLNYTFFFDWNLNSLMESGGLGIFMLVWGIALIVIAVPVLTYFYGKRWYCSWVCGCGGLAETLGDPYRQLSDKSLSAWRFERYIIHGVLLFAVVMTGMVLYHFFSGSSSVLFIDSNSIRSWYGFLIGSAFAGVVGTGFYPLMGNRVWCRFGCPLAAYLGLVQKFKSRFRITTNGGQCISCGNCSTYCEMGIDVRWYAQRGQDIVRSSCVGCGVCSAVCPRGVLRLENSSADTNTRATELRTIHISEDEIKLLS